MMYGLQPTHMQLPQAPCPWQEHLSRGPGNTTDREVTAQLATFTMRARTNYIGRTH